MVSNLCYCVLKLYTPSIGLKLMILNIGIFWTWGGGGGGGGFKPDISLAIIGTEGAYPYTQDIMALDSQPAAKSFGIDQHLGAIVSPLHLPAWERRLAKHPDREYAHYILRGIEYGFHIGVNQARVFKSAKKDMLSAQ